MNELHWVITLLPYARRYAINHNHEWVSTQFQSLYLFYASTCAIVLCYAFHKIWVFKVNIIALCLIMGCKMYAIWVFSGLLCWPVEPQIDPPCHMCFILIVWWIVLNGLIQPVVANMVEQCHFRSRNRAAESLFPYFPHSHVHMCTCAQWRSGVAQWNDVEKRYHAPPNELCTAPDLLLHNAANCCFICFFLVQSSILTRTWEHGWGRHGQVG